MSDCPRNFTKEEMIKRLQAGRSLMVDRSDAPELVDLQELEKQGLVFAELVEFDEQSSALRWRWRQSFHVLVCGGREYSHRQLLYGFMNELKDNLWKSGGRLDVIISGCAPGADSLAIDWAKERKIELALFPAEWKKYRRLAGPLRNKRMLDEGKPDLVVAFPGGSGTAHMVRHAETSGVKVLFPVITKEFDI